MTLSSLFNISIFKNNPTDQKQFSSFEIFNIWNAAQIKYCSMTNYNFLLNFIHDKDFYILLSEILNDTNNQILQIEKQGKKCKINFPNRPPKEINIKEKVSKYIGDKQIFKIVLINLCCEITILSNCIIKTKVNDPLREMFIDFTLTALKNHNNLIKYGKLKNWLEIDPVIKQTGKKEKEKISAAEAANIWDHINIRYDHIEITKNYLDFIHDFEFKKIVKRGENILSKQANTLEKISIKYGLSLPERPAAFNKSQEEPEFINDKFIFRTIFSGVKNSTHLHINAIIVCTRNDKLRKFFFKLLKDELSIFDSFLRYGKMKGWIHLPPMFR